jgi:hypothetical protein
MAGRQSAEDEVKFFFRRPLMFFRIFPYLHHPSMAASALYIISINPASRLASAVITTTITTR